MDLERTEYIGFVPERIKRRKPASARKETPLRVRMAEAHMKEIRDAADRVGITLSAWVTERLLRCAREEQRQVEISGTASTTR